MPAQRLASDAKYDDAHAYRYEAPWVMQLAGRYALHTAYWHEEFGRHHGNGCVNLAPADAQYLWTFTSPELPPGWASAHAVDEDGARGTWVRIR